MIINNVRLVLDNEVVTGSLECHQGMIRALADTPQPVAAGAGRRRRLAAAGAGGAAYR